MNHLSLYSKHSILSVPDVNTCNAHVSYIPPSKSYAACTGKFSSRSSQYNSKRLSKGNQKLYNYQ